ncbi:hypothetical protein C8R44DRAFT_983447 [Mycena epipterygia]|nr:hypothetical protein C8R44DRAFT_983447 [Mycena epipterygia]
MESCPLPIEVVDLILDHLHSDPLALKACSVVCRSWIPSCRAHLFRHLQLRPSGRASPESWNHFLSSSPHSHLTSYIKELEILCERSSWVSWDPILPALLGKLENIENIELHGCDLPWLPAPLTSAIYTLFRSPFLKRVDLRLCVLPSSCFNLFGPSLECIVLSDVTIEPDATVHAEEQTRIARPKRLKVEGKSVGAVVDWLIPSSERNELEELQLLCLTYQGDDPDTLQAVNRLLQHATSLKKLHIYLYPAYLQSTSAVSVAPSICYNHQLRELRLSHFDMHISSPTNQLPWLVSLLSQMTTQHMVQKIAIDARHRPSSTSPILDQKGWANVDDILARIGPSHLRDVHIQIGEAYSLSVAKISSSMPILCGQGILRVTM